jgi:Na+-driven multidrug efflux pump
VTEISISVVLVVFNTIIFGLSGDMGVAAYGVIANILIVIIAMFNGIAQGVQPLISKYYGQGSGTTARLVVRYALVLMAAVAALVYGAVFLFAYPIAGAFNNESNLLLQQLAIQGLRIYFVGAVFAGFNIIVSMYFAATDRPRPAQVVSVLRGFVVILPLVFLLSAVGGITGVWLTFPVAELLVSAGFVVYLLGVSKTPLMTKEGAP